MKLKQKQNKFTLCHIVANVILCKGIPEERDSRISHSRTTKRYSCFPSNPCAKTSEVFFNRVYFLLVSTDYFGGFGEQYSTLYATTENGYETITVYRG